MDMIEVTILHWDVNVEQIKMCDNSNNVYYLEGCLPPDGIGAIIIDPPTRFNVLGDLLCNGNHIGAWVLHTNDKVSGYLQRYQK